MAGKADSAPKPHTVSSKQFAQWLSEHRASIVQRWLKKLPAADRADYCADDAIDASLVLRALTDQDAAEQLVATSFSRASRPTSPTSASALNLTSWYSFLQDMRQSMVAELQDTTPADLSFELLVAVDDAFSRLMVRLAGLFQQRLDGLADERAHFETLFSVTHEIATHLDLDRVAHSALKGAIKIAGADLGLLLILDRESGRLFPWASTDWDAKPITPKTLPAEWIEGWRAEPIPPIGDITALPPAEWQNALQLPPTVSALIIAPIVANGEFYGLLALGSQQPNRFSDSDLADIQAIASQVAGVSENAEIYRLINRQAQELGGMLRHQQEEGSKSQAILESIADGVVVNSPQGRVILMNSAAERILNRSRDNLLSADIRHLIEAFDSPGRAIALAAVERMLAQANTPSQIRPASVMLEVGNRVINAHMAPVIARLDEFLGVVTIFRDITKEVESDRAKSEFISTVSHELRTPMTAIKGYTDLLSGGVVGPLNESQIRFVSVVQNNTNRLIALINDLLDISRIETGLVRFEPAPLRIGEVISEVVEALAARAQENGLALTSTVDANLPELMGDRDRIHQVLTNLVGNAINYTLAGSISIEATSVSQAVQMSVRDTGIGIKPEDISHIFDRFYRGDDPIVQEAGGTGLGLPIVKMFVEMHGGRVWVDSEVGTGSTFTFILPTPDAQPELKTPKHSTSTPPVVTRTILVVDDDNDIAQLVRLQLEGSDYRVLTASRRHQALEIAQKEKVDLILLDRILPDGDGLEILGTLKASPSTADIPVIILSIVEDEGEARARGASAYLGKPFSAQLLLDQVEMALARHGRVLIVEDHKDTANMLARALQNVGFSTEIARDGYEGLVSARRARPDVILLDLRLPGMDGYEALNHLKRSTTTVTIPTIAISGQVTNPVAERERLIMLGATELLLKPLDIEELISAIDRAMELTRASDLPASKSD